MQAVAATEVTDDYLDSTDHIAYQYSNLIQPHVLFLNVDRQKRLILNASTNVDTWLGISAEDVIGVVLADNLFPGITDLLFEMEQNVTDVVQVFTHRVKNCSNEPLICRIIATSKRCWMIELEPEYCTCDVKIDIQKLESLLLQGIQALSSDASVQELVSKITQDLREVLGFERGMCYRFDEENNGEVVAESTALTADIKYLGLRFPARDIPRTAREMLLKCSVRTTLDQRLNCNPIFPCLDPYSQEYVDLTHVRARGAAGACREFYLNMNIRSTLILPLIIDNRLWGLLSFSDSQARRVIASFDKYFQSIAECLAVALERKLQALHEQAQRKGSRVVAELSEVDSTSDQWLSYIQSRIDDLKELIPCDGFALRLSGQVLTVGTAPEAASRHHLVDTIWGLAKGDALNTCCLTQLCDVPWKFKEVAAGVIAIPLSTSNDDIAIWMRRDQKQTVRWAGDPMGKIETDSIGIKRLCVRESFDVWNQVTENKCFPWTGVQLSLAKSACIQLGLLSLSWRAAQASHAKSQFLSCMSHEIRTPMTAILGYANLLKDQHRFDDTSRPTCEYIEVIERNSQHLLAVIDDILNLAKIEAGKLTVEQIAVSIPNVLADVVALMKVQADKKLLGFSIELASPIPQKIFGDEVRLRQILINLLGNAFKFTDHGKVTLRIGYEGSVRQIYFEVIDTGIGLTELQISRLFNTFSQADSSTTRRFGGSGLGLKISKNLAQLMGGDITVQSELGVGSIFRVTLACGSESDEFIHQIDGPNAAGNKFEVNDSREVQTSALPSLGSLRIMLLEDGEDNQRLLRHLLCKAGADVTIFANGKVGIESVTSDGTLDGPLLSPFPFDIILTDMQMPELDGYSTTKLLRQKGCCVPIVALTAFAMQGNDAECIRAGCSDYLSKPVKRETLLVMCKKWSPNTSSTLMV